MKHIKSSVHSEHAWAQTWFLFAVRFTIVAQVLSFCDNQYMQPYNLAHHAPMIVLLFLYYKTIVSFKQKYIRFFYHETTYFITYMKTKVRLKVLVKLFHVKKTVT